MRYITCVATKNIQGALQNWVGSLRHVGWDGTIYVYSPENDYPDVPDGCVNVLKPAWWLSTDGGVDMLKEVNNTPALLKPSIFLDDWFQNGDQVLYVDCADTVFFKNPNELFDLCIDVPVSARDYCMSSRDVVLPEYIYKELQIPMSVFGRDRTVNSGVICCTIGYNTRCIMELWQALCSYIPSTGSWLQNKKKVGDQKAFNIAMRTGKCWNEDYVSYLPKRWNDRDGIRHMYLENGKLYSTTDNQEVCLPHSAGNKSLPLPIRNAAVGKWNNEKLFFGSTAELPDPTEKVGPSHYSPSEIRAMRRRGLQKVREDGDI